MAACSPGGAPVVAQLGGQANVTAPPGTKSFVIDPGQSEAHFIINEVLGGAPNTVIGKTNKVSGQIFASYDNPSATSIGPITVDLSGLATDSGMRNRMIQGSILETENPAYQFARFSMTKLDGLPAKITLGQPFDFKITGNLTLHGVTKEATFDATVTPVSDTRLNGKASLTVQYADWGVRILHLPQQVASVEDKTILEIVFGANAQ
jgi:polyisoprenoid-binding protein YceI